MSEAGNARVVDQHVESAEMLTCHFKQLFAVRLRCYVRRHGNDMRATLVQLTGQVVQLFRRAGGDNNARAGGGRLFRHASPYAARRAGDDHAQSA